MSILIVQLSDLHFKWPADGLATRAKAVQQAVSAKIANPDVCFLVFSGDIANTGDPREYAIALDFINDLKRSLQAEGCRRVETIAVPGNHDLNLRQEIDTRQFLLESPEQYLKKPVDFSGNNFAAIIGVQDDFFGFEAEARESVVVPNHERLYYRRSFAVGSLTVIFHCFNTAWLSRRNEIQAKLFLPEQIFGYSTPQETTLSVAVFHHPYNWLDANNQRFLKNYVESQADVVLTGHEHEGNADRRLGIKGQGLDYLQAPAFCDPSISDNGFQAILADFEADTQQIFTFHWDGRRFTEIGTAAWTLHRNANRPSNPFQLRPEFVKTLQEMGTGFRHPRCVPPQCELRLRDLYVYPDLLRRRLDKVKSVNGAVENVSGEAFRTFLDENNSVVIFGADDCGKTSFARILYEDLTEQGLVPLLIRGDQLRGISGDGSLVKLLSGAVIEQYATPTAEPYLQSDRVKKVVLVDDFDKAKLSRESQASVLDLLRSRVSRTVVFASDILQIQDMAATTEANPFAGFERCVIKEFGRYHRNKLIKAWLSLGREGLDEIQNIDKLVSQSDQTISTLLGKNVLPHHPVTILTLLQMLESKETINTANGAYGYMYEVLLKSALAKVSSRDVDEKVTYMSGIGYAMFKLKQPVLTEEELRKSHIEYCDRYDMVRDFSKMIADLTKAEILIENKKTYRFKYPYGFYYSTAKYFQDHATSLRWELFTIADHIYGDVNANVLIFYVYLTKDEELIRHIVSNARLIYSSYRPCDLSKDVEFINKLATTKPPPLVLECEDVSLHRDEHNRRRDSAEEQLTSNAAHEELEVTYDEKLQELVKITISFKTLQIVGQILRNFTGSLEGPVKLDMTKECYALGMRTLNAILSLASADIEGTRQYLGSLIAERSGITDNQELAAKTDDAIVWLGNNAAFGAIKRISYAVGHSDLTNTYGKVLEQNGDLATEVIDTAIKLDHFDRVPERELSKLATKVQKNNFAFTVIRDLVADYLYLYSVDFPTMQSLGSKWNISVSTPKLLSNRAKK